MESVTTAKQHGHHQNASSVGKHSQQRPLAFLPNMCTPQAVLLLVLLSELLAVALSLDAHTQLRLDWESLGVRSVLIQWVVLLSAAMLCPLRFWLFTLPGWLAASLCYGLVLLTTALCSMLGLAILAAWQWPDMGVVANNLILAAIFAGIVLRYLYVQQQWHNQQQAELKARIQALHSRIQPHFLFNSMNSIASLIATRPEQAEQLVEDLSSLFRASLAEPSLISLMEELDLCRYYMDIEQSRLGERLQVQWQLPSVEQQRSSQVPSLLLQPLLENAIVHGISRLPEGGEVKVQVSLRDKGKATFVDVSIDNPVPHAHSSEPTTTASGNRLALENIRHRLAGVYGQQASFSVEQGDDYYCARLSFPASSSPPSTSLSKSLNRMIQNGCVDC